MCGEWQVSIRRACAVLEFDTSSYHRIRAGTEPSCRGCPLSMAKPPQFSDNSCFSLKRCTLPDPVLGIAATTWTAWGFL